MKEVTELRKPKFEKMLRFVYWLFEQFFDKSLLFEIHFNLVYNEIMLEVYYPDKVSEKLEAVGIRHRTESNFIHIPVESTTAWFLHRLSSYSCSLSIDEAFEYIEKIAGKSKFDRIVKEMFVYYITEVIF